MSKAKLHRLIGRPAVSLLAAMLLAQPAAAATIGVTTATNPQATGTPPDAAKRVLHVGTDMFANELVNTSPAGETQLLFVDGSNLTIGPNSSMKLDQYIYDPSTGVGKMSVSASLGVLRFVGGKLSKTNELTINTPNAVIGVRGGIALVSVARDGTSTATLAYGKSLTVTGSGGSVEITRPGFSTTVGRNQPPSSPAPVTPEALSQMNQQLEGRPGANGGTTAVPTNQQVSAAPLNSVLQTAVQTQQQQQAIQQTTTAIATAAATSTAQTTAVASTTPTQAQVPATQMAIDQGLIPDSVLASANALKITPPVFGAYNVVNDPSLNSPIPFLLNQNITAGVQNLKVTPFFIVITNGTYAASSLTPNAGNPGYQAALNVQGTGANQTYELLVALANTSTASSATVNDRPRYLQGRFIVQTKSGPRQFLNTNGSFTSDTPASGVSPFVGNQLPQSVAIPSNTTTFGDTFPSPASGSALVPGTDRPGVGGTVQDVSYSFNNSLVQTALPAGLGTSRTTQTLNGYAAGLNDNLVPAPTAICPNCLTSSRPPSYFVGSSLNDPTNVQISTDASTSRVAATLNLAPFNTPTGSTIVAQYGTLTGNSNKAQTFIDDSHFAASAAFLSSPTSNPQVASTTALSTVNGQTPTNTGSSVIVTATGIEPTTLLPAGASFCQCQYLQWGFFTTGYLTQNGNQGDFVQLGTWAAGPQLSPSDMPQSGTATYTGHAIGTAYSFSNFNVSTGSNAYYLAAGGFTNQWNFGNRSGNLTISNFDGTTYTGTASAANGRDYTGTLTGGARAAAVGGSFFGVAGNPAAETGGQFRIVGPGYQAAGIFAGRK